MPEYLASKIRERLEKGFPPIRVIVNRYTEGIDYMNEFRREPLMKEYMRLGDFIDQEYQKEHPNQETIDRLFERKKALYYETERSPYLSLLHFTKNRYSGNLSREQIEALRGDVKVALDIVTPEGKEKQDKQLKTLTAPTLAGYLIHGKPKDLEAKIIELHPKPTGKPMAVLLFCLNGMALLKNATVKDLAFAIARSCGKEGKISGIDRYLAPDFRLKPIKTQPTDQEIKAEKARINSILSSLK